MTQDRDAADADVAHDASYDRAHDDVPEAGAPVAEQETPPITVATGTPDAGGDYSYDLAHDIPAQEPRG